MSNLLKASLLALALLWQGHSQADNKFLVIIDAGSTGSRVHLFNYQDDKQKKIPDIHQIYMEKTPAILDNYLLRVNRVENDLQGAFKRVKALLEKRQIKPKQTELHVLATGGMRSLPEKQQAKIFAKLRKFLLQYPFFDIKTMKTISGHEEAVYGWLSANAAANRLGRPPVETFGLLDLGGASLEIAYALDSDGRNISNICIKSQCYRLYTKSILNMGLERMFRRAAHDVNAKTCFPNAYPYQPGKLGAFDYDTCYKIASNQVEVTRNALEGQIPKGRQFIATSGFHYTYDFFRASLGLPHLKELASVTCENSDWKELLNHNPDHNPKSVLIKCYASALTVALLTYPDGLGFDFNSTNLQLVNKYDKKSIAWTLGAALYLNAGRGMEGDEAMHAQS